MEYCDSESQSKKTFKNTTNNDSLSLEMLFLNICKL